MTRAVPTAFVIAAMCTFALTSCGSSNNSKTISKAEFLKRGNAICKQGNDETNAAANKEFPHNKKPNQAQLVKFVKVTIIPSVQSQINRIRALGAPAGDKAKVDQLVNSAQAALDQGKKNPVLLTSNGPGPFAKTNQLTKAYGLTVCGSG